MKPCYRSICIILVLALNSTINTYGQPRDVNGIIDSVEARLNRVVDYQANIEVEVDVDFIKMPVKHATILYKQPDKIKLISDEFLMLPKRGLGKRVTKILEEPYTALYLGEDTINGRIQHLIRIVPMGRKPEVILATWWVDTSTFQISRNESNLRDGGSFVIDFIYEHKQDILPKEMVFSFEIEKLNLPLKFIGKSQGIETDPSEMKPVSQGKVYLRFSEYRINTGINDEMF